VSREEVQVTLGLGSEALAPLNKYPSLFFYLIMASEEEYSDLTELETDDDEKTTKKKTKSGSGKEKDGGYKIRNALKVPRATTYTAQALHGTKLSYHVAFSEHVFWQNKFTHAISTWSLSTSEVRSFFDTVAVVGEVDFWIRFADVVWSEGKQIGIIDSVFRNFYIPPIIFAVNTFEDGSESKTCIDGKQRLTSIHRYGFHL
jgi:hypothetical protein